MPRTRTVHATTPVDALKHHDKRVNIPTADLHDFVADAEQSPPMILYPRDPSLDPQLVWRGKDEQDAAPLEVPAVPVYIQEKIHPQAIIENVRAEARHDKPQSQLSLFSDFNGLPFEEMVDFYHHDVHWSNRMILGDSLLVMTSLAEKEGLKGQVQMIYLDPPYGIKFGSNWQVSTRKRDVKDGKVEDATRQPEQVRAFRDTWQLGIHSYLAYLRDRLVVARELLTESGSIFVQIGDENVHLVRCLLDEVFGSENMVAIIMFQKSGAFTSGYLPTVGDYILWYGKERDRLKYRSVFLTRGTDGSIPASYDYVEADGLSRRILKDERLDVRTLPTGSRLFQSVALTSSHEYSKGKAPFEFDGVVYLPGNRYWSTSPEGLQRLAACGRLFATSGTLRYKMLLEDFPVVPLTNMWTDVMGASDIVYVVQTASRVIERCLLMTTDPGDLVLDPTCVRKGTRVWTPSLTLPLEGEGIRRSGNGGAVDDVTASPPPSRGELEGGISELVPIESLQLGDTVLDHSGQPRRIVRVIRKSYCGRMVGLRHSLTSETLWLTADHLVLCKPRPRGLGGQRDWSASPLEHLERRRQLRREASPPERRLWSALRQEQMGVKFRHQHPIGPYIADFYSREAHLVVEVDGATHFEAEAMEYDAARDAYMRDLGLDVLRFTTLDVLHNLEGVCLAIENHCRIRTQSIEGAQWMQAANLLPGDIVFYGPDRQAVAIDVIESTYAEEDVYDLEVADGHSFLTGVCAVHNCGSGTTAYVAEQWGRRWITVDTSRVALALARTRLMSARYPYYTLADSPEGRLKEAELTGHLPHVPPSSSPLEGGEPAPSPSRGRAGEGDVRKGFVYKRVPHITLKSIANNEEIDEIHARWLQQMDPIRTQLSQLISPLLLGEGQGVRLLEEWQIPREAQPSWPAPAKQLHTQWWDLRRRRQQEIDASIARRADTELLYDQPYEDNKRIRVAGPFTVESLSPHRVLSAAGADLPATEAAAQHDQGATGFVQTILDNLKSAGVQNTVKQERIKFDRLETYPGEWLHAAGEYTDADGTVRRVAVSIGPEHGTVSPDQVKAAAKEAVHGIGFDILIVCGFAFDPYVSEEVKHYGKLTVLPVRMNPDLAMGGDLLKKTGAGNLFMVFGEPDLEVKKQPDGRLVVEINGLDVYDPTTGQIRSSSTDDIACWFIDTDYNEESFFVRHAYFTGAGDPYEKLKRALRAEIDESAWATLYTTTSYPFDPPTTGRIAVKVINHYGDECLKVIAIR